MANKKLISRSEFARLVSVSAASVTKACDRSLLPACVGKKIDLNHAAAKKYLQKKTDEADEEIPATGLDSRYEEAIQHCRATGKYSERSVSIGLEISRPRAKKIVAMMKAAQVIPVKGEPPPIIKQPARVIKGHTAKRNTKKAEALQKIEPPGVEHGSTVHEIPAEIEKFVDMTLRELIARFGTDYAFNDWLKATKSIEDINEKRLKNAQTRGELVNRDLIRKGVIEPINSAHIKLLTDGAKTLARRVTTMHSAGTSVEEIEKFIADQISSFIRPVKTKVARILKNA